MGASFLFVYKNLTSPGLHASKLVAQPPERCSGKPDPFCSDADLRRCGSEAACLPALRPSACLQDNGSKLSCYVCQGYKSRVSKFRLTRRGLRQCPPKASTAENIIPSSFQKCVFCAIHTHILATPGPC